MSQIIPDWVDEEFDNATTASFDDTPVPSGTYNVSVDEVRLEETKNNPRPMFCFVLSIIDGTYIGRKLWHRRVAAGDSLPYLKGDLSILGIVTAKMLEQRPDLSHRIVLNKFSDLNDEFNRARINGTTLQVKVKTTSGDGDRINTNINIQKLIDVYARPSDTSDPFGPT